MFTYTYTGEINMLSDRLVQMILDSFNLGLALIPAGFLVLVFMHYLPGSGPAPLGEMAGLGVMVIGGLLLVPFAACLTATGAYELMDKLQGAA